MPGSSCIAAVSTGLKAGVLPWLLRRAIRESGAVREIEPFIGFTTSLLVGVGLLGLCFLHRLPATGPRGRGDPAC